MLLIGLAFALAIYAGIALRARTEGTLLTFAVAVVAVASVVFVVFVVSTVVVAWTLLIVGLVSVVESRAGLIFSSLGVVARARCDALCPLLSISRTAEALTRATSFAAVVESVRSTRIAVVLTAGIKCPFTMGIVCVETRATSALCVEIRMIVVHNLFVLSLLI